MERLIIVCTETGCSVNDANMIKRFKAYMIKYELDILNALNEDKILPKCIIAGSWAMYFYKYAFEDFIPPIATTDFY